MNSRKFLPLTVISLAVLAGLSACSLAADVTPPPGYVTPTPVPTSVPVYPVSLPNPTSGASLYAENCAGCHGETGLGDGAAAADLPVVPPAIGSAQVAGASMPIDWYQMITDGNLNNYMPGFRSDLSDSQRWDVLSYVYSLSSSDQEIASGQAVYAENCASCHGESGAGDGSQAASLSTPPANLTDAVAMSRLSSENLIQQISQGISPDMPAFQEKLNEDQLRSVTSYTRSLWLGSASSDQASANTRGTVAATGSAPATPSSETAAASTVGSVQGKVTNESGGPLPAGAEVTLHGYDNMDETLTLTTPLSEDGTYLFSGVEMPAERVFLTSIDYNGLTFSSEIGQVTTESSDLNLSLLIYDTSTDASALSADRLHMIFTFPQTDVVEVVELMIVSNPTDRVIIPASSDQGVITFELPEGATGLQFQSGALGERYLQTANGFSDTEPVYPGSGQHQVLFAYDLPYDKGIDFNQVLPLDTSAVVVMVPNVGVSLESSLLAFSGNRTMQNTEYAVYTTSGLVAGDSLSARLSGEAKVSSSGLASDNNMLDLLIGLAVLGLTLIGAGFWFLKRRGQAQTAAETAQEAQASATAAKDPDTLIDEIIALDDLYRSGKLSEVVYRERRAELKAQLKEEME